MHRSNNNGTHPACAACKHQRKKCSEECILAKYFPANRAREFQAVHKVFGVSNVTKIVRNVGEEDRHRVAESLIWEALCRQKDPILGSYGEFKRVYEELKVYRSQGQGLNHLQNQNYQLGQMQVQGGMGYKPNLLGWNSEEGFVSEINNGLGYNSNENNNHDENAAIAALDSFCYTSQFVQSSQKSKQEIIEVDSVVIPMLQQQQQQQSINGFSHQYYNISGIFIFLK